MVSIKQAIAAHRNVGFFDGKEITMTNHEINQDEFENGKGTDTPADATTPEAPKEGE